MMLLPYLLLCLADVIANMADVIAICTCFERQMLFARVADGIAYLGWCEVRCYDHMWQMEQPLSTLLFQF